MVKAPVRAKLRRCSGVMGECQGTAKVPLSKVLNPNADIRPSNDSFREVACFCPYRLQTPPRDPERDRAVKEKGKKKKRIIPLRVAMSPPSFLTFSYCFKARVHRYPQKNRAR